jgi:hypothetical protein
MWPFQGSLHQESTFLQGIPEAAFRWHSPAGFLGVSVLEVCRRISKHSSWIKRQEWRAYSATFKEHILGFHDAKALKSQGGRHITILKPWPFFFFFLFFFCGTGVWIQRLHLEAFHQPFFLNGFFQDRVLWTSYPGWFQTMILLISASWVARTTGMNHQCSADTMFF